MAELDRPRPMAATVFSADELVRLVIVGDPLGFRIESHGSSGPCHDVAQMAERRRKVTNLDVGAIAECLI